MTVFVGSQADFYVAGDAVVMSNEATALSADFLSFSIISKAHRVIDAASALTVETGLADVQTLTITGGTPTSGSFAMTFGGQSATVNWNETASSLQGKLQALSSIGTGNITCTGGPLPATGIICTFAGTKAPGSQALFTFGSNTMNNSATPAIAHTTTGTAYATVSDYTLYDIVGRVTFLTSQAGKLCRISGKYLPLATCGNGQSWSITTEFDLLKATIFRDTWTKFKPGRQQADGSLNRFYADQYFWDRSSETPQTMVAAFWIDADNSVGVIAWVRIKTEALKDAADSFVMEDVAFQIEGQPFLQIS